MIGGHRSWDVEIPTTTITHTPSRRTYPVSGQRVTVSAPTAEEARTEAGRKANHADGIPPLRSLIAQTAAAAREPVARADVSEERRARVRKATGGGG